MLIDEIKRRLEAARSLAIEAGKLTLEYFRQPSLQVEHKADGSPLTMADQAAERYLRDAILDQFPADSILGEEFGSHSGASEFRWILDPIDGTKSFICGVPFYGTMIGVEVAGEAAVGAVYFPALDEGIYGATGHGAFSFVGQTFSPARVSETRSLADAVVLTTSVEAFDTRGALEDYLSLTRRAKFARTWGDVYGYLLVATGRAEIMIDPLMNLWDAAALLPILREAGGMFTDWQGEERIDGGDSIGSNGHLHHEVVSCFSRITRRTI
jgi:histidinol-phosphatase